MVYSGTMTLENPQVPPQTKGEPINTPREYPSPPFLKGLGITDSVRTPLGHYRTESLFLERWRPIEGQRPVYTLQIDDREDPRVPGRIMPSFQAAYLKLMDPTGYRAAKELLGSWKHWVKLREAEWFKDHLDEWNAEVLASLKAKGLATFLKQAEEGDLKAADWLINYTPEGPAERKARGRPTRADINKAAAAQAEAERNSKADAARLGL